MIVLFSVCVCLCALSIPSFCVSNLAKEIMCCVRQPDKRSNDEKEVGTAYVCRINARETETIEFVACLIIGIDCIAMLIKVYVPLYRNWWKKTKKPYLKRPQFTFDLTQLPNFSWCCLAWLGWCAKAIKRDKMNFFKIFLSDKRQSKAL